jgi:hypothetical protein
MTVPCTHGVGRRDRRMCPACREYSIWSVLVLFEHHNRAVHITRHNKLVDTMYVRYNVQNLYRWVPSLPTS